MSILLQNAKAAFEQVAPSDGRYHLVISADLVGHSELQDRLIKHIASSKTLKSDVQVVSGSSRVPQMRVHLSANEREIAALLAEEDKNREEQKVDLDRSYTDIAADTKLAEKQSAAPSASGSVSGKPASAPVPQTNSLPAQTQRGPAPVSSAGEKNGTAPTSEAQNSNPEVEERASTTVQSSNKAD